MEINDLREIYQRRRKDNSHSCPDVQAATTPPSGATGHSELIIILNVYFEETNLQINRKIVNFAYVHSFCLWTRESIHIPILFQPSHISA